MAADRKRKACNATFIHKHHLCLRDLKMCNHDLKNIFLVKTNVPEYPQPEFHVAALKHDTDRGGLLRIWKDEGFKDPHGGSRDPDSLSLVWWSLSVGPQEVQSAETRLLDQFFPNRMEKQAAQRTVLDELYLNLDKQESFLWKFATSPAFSEKSRFGSYRFTFPLQEVVTAYSQQCCSGAPPVMRVFKTSVFKQEVQYVVLLHSPAREKLFSEYPLLPYDDPNAVCTYRDGYFIWRSQAMCETHSHRLIHRPQRSLMDTEWLYGREQFYVWDNVAIGLHVDSGQVLKFDCDRLRATLTFCEEPERNVSTTFTFCDERERNVSTRVHYDKYENAQTLVEDLWPDSDSSLEKEPSLELIFKGNRAVSLLSGGVGRPQEDSRRTAVLPLKTRRSIKNLMLRDQRPPRSVRPSSRCLMSAPGGSRTLKDQLALLPDLT